MIGVYTYQMPRQTKWEAIRAKIPQVVDGSAGMKWLLLHIVTVAPAGLKLPTISLMDDDDDFARFCIVGEFAPQLLVIVNHFC